MTKGLCKGNSKLDMVWRVLIFQINFCSFSFCSWISTLAIYLLMISLNGICLNLKIHRKTLPPSYALSLVWEVNLWQQLHILSEDSSSGTNALMLLGLSNVSHIFYWMFKVIFFSVSIIMQGICRIAFRMNIIITTLAHSYYITKGISLTLEPRFPKFFLEKVLCLILWYTV